MLTTTIAENKKLTFCSCKKQLVAKFYCDDETCPFHKTQFRYCKECSSKERHNHMVDKISDRCLREFLLWKQLVAKADEKLQAAENNI